MKRKLLLLFAATAFVSANINSQYLFDPTIEVDFSAEQVVLPPSPLQYQILFIGGVDKVQTVDNNGAPNGEALAKQWHDFIGITPDPSSNDVGWVSINHEMILANDSIGDGGGMTVFKLGRDPNTDSLIIVEQTLTDGRTGNYFNVDFKNTVGETGMNCGGITSSYDGRIWTAEEWFRTSNSSIHYNSWFASPGVNDTSDFTISGSGIACADGQTVKKYENFNYMVEIDPREAKAIRKQYNWGRQPFEGGCIMNDNQTVFAGADNTPGLLTKFVATNPGDFTQGSTYIYKQDIKEKVSLRHLSVVEDQASEIVAYDATNDYVYTTDADAGLIRVQNYAGGDFTLVRTVDMTPYGDEPTSVAVGPNGNVAVSVVGPQGTLGKVVFVDQNGSVISNVTVGYHPDMVAWSPDGNKVMCANEGEPDDWYMNDPVGTVSLIDVSGGLSTPLVSDIGFTAFNSQQAALEAQGVRIFGQIQDTINNTSTPSTVAQDLEPEYIAFNSNSTKAFVACQENNAIAVIDIASATCTNIHGLGYKDYSFPQNAIDPSDDDNIDGNFNTYPVFGMFQPDAIATYEVNGNTYIVTANEGDARDYDGYSEEYRLDDFTLDPNAFPNAAFLQNDTVLGRLKVSDVGADVDGDGDVDIIYNYGARSFSIWDENGTLVYDSGNEFARMLLKMRPDNFPDNRSDDKGSEPESITIGEIDGHTYAFIGLERATGIMVYDITDPSNSHFVDYFNNDDTDWSPEGLAFANINGKNILLVGNEAFGGGYYQGSLSAYEVQGGSNWPLGNWVELDNTDFEVMKNVMYGEAWNARATMFNRIEWVPHNVSDDKIYFTCTGRDNPGSRWTDEYHAGGTLAEHVVSRATAQGTEPLSSDYTDYYGRIMVYDPATDEVEVFLEGGPEYDVDVPAASYPDIHLSNPDGLGFLYVNGNTFMLIQEDLNGTSNGRVPAGQTTRTCELYALDMSINTPTLNDLMRISQVPAGAELTGATGTPDGKSILINSQHPSSSNPYPYNNSLTYAITGFDKLFDDYWMTNTTISESASENGFDVYPNPASREILFNRVTDVAIYSVNGQRVMVERNTKRVDVSSLNPGIYFVKNSEGQTKKLIIE